MPGGKFPHGKLIGSPGKFFDHNRLWHLPGPVRLCVQAPGWLTGRQRGAERRPWGGSLRAQAGPGHCQGSPKLVERMVRGGGLEPQTQFQVQLQHFLLAAPGQVTLPFGASVSPFGKWGYQECSPYWIIVGL